MAYRFRDQEPGDMLRLPSGQLVIKTGRKQALCMHGASVSILLDVPATTDVDRIADREDVVQAALGDR